MSETNQDLLLKIIEDMSHWHDRLNERQSKLTQAGLGDAPLIKDLEDGKEKLVAKMEEIIAKATGKKKA